MMVLTVYLSKALLCTATACYPVLVGPATPLGEFTLTQRLTQRAGYGGDILQFSESRTNVLAIHRIWLLRPSEKRERRIKSSNPKDRVITKGCINVDPKLYDQLVVEYRGGQLHILP